MTVELTVTDESGAETTQKKKVAGGPTEVLSLKVELGVPAESALWVIDKHGKKRQLADHAMHNVKEGDHYEALVRGGVS